MTAPSPMTRPPSPEQPLSGWRLRWYTIIFEADTRAGRLFDVVLIVVILLSIGVVMADSVQSVHLAYGGLLVALEWFFTALFTAEYIARLVCVRRRLQYATSFFGVSICWRYCPPIWPCSFRA